MDPRVKPEGDEIELPEGDEYLLPSLPGLTRQSITPKVVATVRVAAILSPFSTFRTVREFVPGMTVAVIMRASSTASG